MKKRLLAVLLLITLIASMCSTVFAVEIKDGNNDGEINLVTLGASNTNGYGIRGYLPASVTEDPLAADKSKLNVYGYERAPATAYPAQVAAVLENNTGKDVKLNQLAISSMRVEEVRMLLDNDYYGDAYTAWRFYNANGDGWFAQAESQGANSGEEALANLRSAYQTAITNADVITMDVGLNNFGVFAFNNIKANLADGRFWKEPDFSQIMDVDEKLCYDKVKEAAMALLTTNIKNTDPDLLNKLEMVTDTLTYATLGYCYNFDIVMGKIYDMNPDVNVVVVSIQNMFHGVTIEFEGGLLPMGEIYGELIALANIYTATGSPYSNRYVFAHIGENGHATTFLDEILAWNGDPETLTDNMKDCFDMYDDGLYVRSIIEYMMVAPILLNQPLPTIVQDMIHSGNIDLDSVMESDDEELLMYLYNASLALRDFRAEKGANLGEQGVAVYNAYNNALNTAYGIVATVVQEVLQNDTIEIDADSLNGFGNKADTLMGYIFGEVLKGAQTTFEASFVDPSYEYDGFVLNEDLLADPAVTAIAVLSARFDLGNSFYAHLNEEGHDEVTDAIMEALENDISGDEFVDDKFYEYSHAEYVITPDSYYVAIDGLYADDYGYADKVAAELGIPYAKIAELDEEEIAKADLITVRYNNEPMIGQMIKDAKNYKKVQPKDWTVYVGEDGATYVQDALLKVEAMLDEMQLGNMKAMAMVAIESYAYECAGHMIGYIKDLKAIAAINPEALIVSVGMNNSLEDAVLVMDGQELALGKYIDYVIDAANMEAYAYVLLTGDAIYVNAPDVATDFDASANTSAWDFILALIDEEDRAVLKANEDGHEYIKDQILNALTMSVYEPEEPETPVLKGDLDKNGNIDIDDVLLCLDLCFVTPTAEDYAVADLDTDGDIDIDDVLLCLDLCF